MNRPLFFATLSSFAFTGAPLTAAAATPPNIVIILADDLGHGDLSSYGCPDIKTPAIDSIGRRGVRLTQFYSNAPDCTPSRTALLTGRYQHRVGGLECAIGLGGVGRYDEAEWLHQRGELGLPRSEITLAEMLRDAGYDTAIFGKWHLGYDAAKFGPQTHGFKESFVLPGAAADYVTHEEPGGGPPLMQNGKPIPPVTGYMTDIIADRTLAWLDQRKGPFFLYVPFTAPHEPFQAPGDGPAKGSWKDGTRATYVKMVEHLDARVRDILAALDRRADRDNTIVVFFSDNGATGKGSNAPFRGYKAQLWEGGIREPCLISWPREIPAGTESTQVMLNMDLTATLLAAAGAQPPAGRKLDGINLIDPLRGKTPPVSRTVFWRVKNGQVRHKAVRDGDFKFLSDKGTPHLFDLIKDPGESNDLLATMPEKAAELQAKLAAWETDVAAPRLRDFKPEPSASQP